MFRPFVQDYKPFPSTILPICSAPVTMSHSSLYQPVVTSVSYVSPVKIPTATFPFHIPNTYYTSNSIRSVFSELKTTYTLKSSLFSHQVNGVLKLLEHLSHHIKRNMHLLPLLSPFTHQAKRMLVLPLLQSFLLSVLFYLPILTIVLLILLVLLIPLILD